MSIREGKKLTPSAGTAKVSVVSFGDTRSNKDFRLDSEFWNHSLQANPSLEYAPIGSCLVKSQYGISVAMNADGIGYPIYRMDEIHDMICDFSVSKSADIDAADMSKFRLHDRDVLFNRTNSLEWVGRTGLYYAQDASPAVFASYLVRFQTDERKILPEYLVAFLSCSYGVADIKRRARPSVNQTNVNPEEVKAIQIPLLSAELQNQVREMFDRAHSSLRIAYREFEQSRELFSKVLSFTGQSDGVAAATVSLSNSLLATGRLDAEYYHPTYSQLKGSIRGTSSTYATIGSECDVLSATFIPERETEYQYIELSDIDETGGVTGHIKALGKDLPTRARRRIRSGDVLVPSVEGSLGSCALIGAEYDGALCSSGFYILRPKHMSPSALLVLMKSDVMQALLKQASSGTILASVASADFPKVPMPLVDRSLESQLLRGFDICAEMKRQSADLMSAARQVVELAISEGEDVALTRAQAVLGSDTPPK